jgi:hypothetical protein
MNVFSIAAKRRREIIKHAKYIGAADSDDLSRWLIAWVWHNPGAKDQIWSVMECARNIGRKITETEASAITEEASITPQYRTADRLAKYLGVTWVVRQHLGLTTIGSIDVGKNARKELRKRADRIRSERKRRANGAVPRAEYEANSLSATKPWEELGMSRRTWERHRNKDDASASAPILLSCEDRPASPEKVKGLSEQGFALKKKKEVIRLADSLTLAADIHATLPLELRMAALCLPLVEYRMAA